METINTAIDFGTSLHLDKIYNLPINLKSIKDVPKLDYNPFLNDIKIKKKSSLKKVKEIEKVNEDRNMVIAEENFRDKEPFVRIFHINNDHRIWNISGNGCKVFLYILTEKLSFNSDFIILNPLELSNMLNIKKIDVIYKTMLELIELGVIAGHNERNIYWINPKIIYFGNRGLIQLKTL